MEFEKASHYIQEVLKTQLSPLLFYHSYDHTMGVLKAAVEIANNENIQSEEDLILLKTAALYHDCGFINAYENHTEEAACVIVNEVLPGFGYNRAQIEIICQLIMKTKMPQQPETHLEKILCDADLSYLGHDNFVKIGNKLFQELNAMGKSIDEKEWNIMQIDFLQTHHYWTATAISNREKIKAEHLKRLQEMVLINK